MSGAVRRGCVLYRLGAEGGRASGRFSSGRGVCTARNRRIDSYQSSPRHHGKHADSEHQRRQAHGSDSPRSQRRKELPSAMRGVAFGRMHLGSLPRGCSEAPNLSGESSTDLPSQTRRRSQEERRNVTPGSLTWQIRSATVRDHEMRRHILKGEGRQASVTRGCRLPLSALPAEMTVQADTDQDK